MHVALYTSAWIEIEGREHSWEVVAVALYTSAWIEILSRSGPLGCLASVALYTSAWIEIIGLCTNE